MLSVNKTTARGVQTTPRIGRSVHTGVHFVGIGMLARAATSAMTGSNITGAIKGASINA
jgi:hypothetical protein